MMQPLTDAELRDFARQLGHKLTEPERDALVRVRNEANLALAQRANRIHRDDRAAWFAAQGELVRRRNRIPRVPAGCDAQGRRPQAAEACTDLGADDDDPLRAARGVVWSVIACLLLWCGVALLVVTLASL